MATAIIGTGGLGSVIARHLGAGGENLRLSSADPRSAHVLAGQIGSAATLASDNRDALQGSDAVILALRFTVLEGVIGELADLLPGRLVVVPSNPLTTGSDGTVERVLPAGQASGRVVTGWLPPGARLALAFGTLSADLFEASSNRQPERAVLFYATDDPRSGSEVGRLIQVAGFDPVRAGGVGDSDRLEVGGDLHDVVVGIGEAKALVERV